MSHINRKSSVAIKKKNHSTQRIKCSENRKRRQGKFLVGNLHSYLSRAFNVCLFSQQRIQLMMKSFIVNPIFNWLNDNELTFSSQMPMINEL